jgi:hypothetical protein
MASGFLLIKYETGHSLKAVLAGNDPYTGGFVLTDCEDGFYTADLDMGLYDIYYKNAPADAVWLPLPHYDARFHPTDDISTALADIEALDSRVTTLEGSIPDVPANIVVIRAANSVHIGWDAGDNGTLYIVRGKYHHTDESVTVDSTTRVLYAGYSPFCLLHNDLRFADIESAPFGDIALSFTVSAHNAAGLSAPSTVAKIALDLSESRIHRNSHDTDCPFTSNRNITFLTTSYPGSFPLTSTDVNKRPTGTPARTLSFHRDVRILRIEAESLFPAENGAVVRFCDQSTGTVYSLPFTAGERIATSESSPDGNPNMPVLRNPDSKLFIYSDNSSGLQEVEIRLSITTL